MAVLLTIGEVAEQLRVSSSWIYRKCKTGKIPHCKLGRTVRFKQGDIDRWVDGHTKKGALSV